VLSKPQPALSFCRKDRQQIGSHTYYYVGYCHEAARRRWRLSLPERSTIGIEKARLTPRAYRIGVSRVIYVTTGIGLSRPVAVKTDC